MDNDNTPDLRPSAERFYEARDRRTMQYGATAETLIRPVSLILDPSVLGTPDGMAAAKALADMLIRVHRRVRILGATPIDADGRSDTSLQELHDAARAIDPFQSTHRERPSDDELTIYVVGRADSASTEISADVVVSWTGGRGEIIVRGHAPAPAKSADDLAGFASDAHLLGACTAACLAAAAIFRLAHGDEPAPAAVNLLERTDGANASTATLSGPIDVGDVQVVGAGAVAHALAFWAREFGSHGGWEFIDGDVAELHNTNRCMSTSVAAAGWPGGVSAGPAEYKATSAAAIMGAAAVTDWFDELGADRPRADLVLVLANERNVRAEVAALGEPLLVHATTSANWTAELHRHVAGVDDCPACRIPEAFRPLPRCSTGAAKPGDETSGDAALPFLSAMAGLMLAVSLLDLSRGQGILQGRFNHWPLNMALTGRLWQRVPHPNRCPHVQPQATRDAIQNADPRRWDSLDTS